MRQIELQNIEQEQHLPAQAIPKACGFEAATRSNFPSLRDEAATRCAPAEKKVDLKKQSQFNAAEPTKGAGKREKSVIAATG